jgi:hypothetical protein
LVELTAESERRADHPPHSPQDFGAPTSKQEKTQLEESILRLGMDEEV